MNKCERRARSSAATCKNGWLAAPVNGRCCRKAPKTKTKTKCAKQSCKNGKLKNPVGNRCCRKRRAVYTKKESQSNYWDSFLGYSKRRRRSRR